MSKHTPGPWFAGEMYGHIGLCITRRHPSEYGPRGVIGDAPIAQIWEGASHWENKYPFEANAALIAAAPDMAEALKELVQARMEKSSSPQEADGSDGRYARAREALRKAGVL